MRKEWWIGLSFGVQQTEGKEFWMRTYEQIGILIPRLVSVACNVITPDSNGHRAARQQTVVGI